MQCCTTHIEIIVSLLALRDERGDDGNTDVGHARVSTEEQTLDVWLFAHAKTDCGKQVLRAVRFSAGSALSATILVAFIPAGRAMLANAGYRAAVVGIVMPLAALLLAASLALPGASARSTAPER